MNYTEQLERDTEETRRHLANTIEELRERLTPGQVLDEVLDYASDNGVGEYVRSFRRQVIDNPLPLGLMGVGIGWLMIASAFGSRSNARAIERNAGAISKSVGAISEKTRTLGSDAADKAGDLAAGTRAAAADAANRAGDISRDLASRADDLRAEAADQAAKIADQTNALAAGAQARMRDAAGAAGAGIAAARDSVADSASRGARTIGDTANGIGRGSIAASRAVADFSREQPFIIAATGLVFGAILGAILPKTEAEDRLIGESSDAAKEKLREFAGEQYANAKTIAAQTVEAALDTVEGVAAAPERDEHKQAQEHAGAGEFGPGPGPHASGAHPSSTEDAEHPYAGGA